MAVIANLHQPLRGKVIYIDIVRHNERCKSLERKLQFLGAVSYIVCIYLQDYGLLQFNKFLQMFLKFV